MQCYPTKNKSGICIFGISDFWKCFSSCIIYMLNKLSEVLVYVFVIMLNFRYILILLVFCTVNQQVKINFELIEMLVFNLTKSTLIFTGQTHTVRKDNI